LPVAPFVFPPAGSISRRPIRPSASACWSAEGVFAAGPPAANTPSADQQAEVYEQIGRLKMEPEGVKKKAATFN